MPFTWRINITKNPTPGGPAVFEFAQPPQIYLGDQIFWSNDDTVPHLPCTAGNPTIFMANQIAAKSTSPGFAPGTPGTVTYICSLHPGETGTFEVLATPPAPPVSTGT